MGSSSTTEPTPPAPVSGKISEVPTDSKEWFYALVCADGKYYGGRTNNVERRFEEHRTGTGSAWTHLHKPLPWPTGLLLKKPLTDPLQEDYEVEKLMSQYGIDNVRGGSYVTIALSVSDRICLEKKLRHGRDECFICGKAGHYAVDCTTKTQPATAVPINSVAPRICSRCDRNTHYASTCNAKTKLDGTPLPSKSPAEKTIYPEKHNIEEAIGTPKKAPVVKMAATLTKGCSRCDRTSHDEFTCKAETKLDGTLPPPKSSSEQTERLDKDIIEETTPAPKKAPVVKPSTKTSSRVCSRCDRASHYAPTCNAKTKADGTPLPPKSPEKQSVDIETSAKVCSRCDRDSHSVSTCKAKTKLDGTPLPPKPSSAIACARCNRDFHGPGMCMYKTNKAGKYI